MDFGISRGQFIPGVSLLKKILSKKVEVTVLEVEMADDCVSTSALRFKQSQKSGKLRDRKIFVISVNA